MPLSLYAQDATLTITVASAEVHKGPSTVTPVIGHVARGATEPVLRNLGSWVRIPWPSAPDGVAYVHATMGRLSGNVPAPSALPTSPTAMPTTPAPAPMPAAPPTPAAAAKQSSPRTPDRPVVGVQGAQGTTSISHVLGVGGLVQSARGFGATGRAWRGDRFGVEFRLTRNSRTSGAAAGRMTSVELEPRAVYAIADHVSDYVWVRPYVGSGLTFSHRTLTNSAASENASVNGVQLHVFAGGELTFATMTQVGLSVEVGYRPSSTPFPGFQTDRLGLSIGAHWYIK
jgi:hypothetical protein